MIKRFVMSVLTATFMFAGVLPGALALPSAYADDWCADDPIIDVVTPSGNHFSFHVTDSALGVQHLPTLGQAIVTAGTSRVKGTQTTLVKVLVYIPNDSYGSNFQTKTKAHHENGTTYSNASGNSGHYMSMQWVINVP